MKAKKKVIRERQESPAQAAKSAMRLSKRAKKEVDLLLSRSESGTLTQKRLQAELRELDEDLQKAMTHLIRFYL